MVVLFLVYMGLSLWLPLALAAWMWKKWTSSGSVWVRRVTGVVFWLLIAWLLGWMFQWVFFAGSWWKIANNGSGMWN